MIHTKITVTVLGLAMSVLPFAVGVQAATEAIVGGTVVDLEAGKPIPDGVILIDGDRIEAVGSAHDVKIPEDIKIIHADGRWLLPGLMNMHVHLGLILPGAQAMKLRYETDAGRVLRMEKNAQKSLYTGTTTVRLVSEKDHTEFPLKAAIDRGDIDGPRIFSAGEPVIPTGGHGAEHRKTGIDGKYEVMKFVRQQIQAGATWIKMMISKGIADSRGDIAASDMTEEEMKAAVEIAHSHGVKVAVHTGSPLATMQALEAGVDSYEHGYFLTEKVFKEMKKKEKWYVPTIVVSQPGVMEFFKKIGSPQWYLDRVKLVGKAHWHALQTAIKVGVNIAMGTDQLPYEPNSGTVASVHETELYVKAGMTPLQALRAAMVNPARMLGADQDLGGLQPGKYADIIALTANPLEDISALRTIGFVMKGGKVIRNDWAQ